MRPLSIISQDLSKVNYRISNLNTQLADHATVSQTRLISQRLETLVSIQGALNEEKLWAERQTTDRMSTNIVDLSILCTK